MAVSQGSPGNPVRLNNHLFGPILKEVHWTGKLVGVLTLVAPDLSDFIANTASNFTGPYNPGDTIRSDDIADSVFPLVRVGVSDDTMVSTLFERHYFLWVVEAVAGLPGTRPDKPPDRQVAYDNYVSGTGVGTYGGLHHVYTTSGPNFSLIEVATLLELPDPDHDGGVSAGSINFWAFGSSWTGHWPDTIDAHGHQLYEPFTGFSHGTDYPNPTPRIPDPDVPSYSLYQQWDDWEPRELVGFALGTHKQNVDKVITSHRQTWLVAFNNLDSGDDVRFTQPFSPTDSDLPSADATFTLQIYNAGSFVVGSAGVVTNVGGTLIYSGSQTVPYDTTETPAIRFDKTGFL